MKKTILAFGFLLALSACSTVAAVGSAAVNTATSAVDVVTSPIR